MDRENVARNPADLVTYQETSVVSKTIHEKKTGTVTLFAFDKGQLLVVGELTLLGSTHRPQVRLGPSGEWGGGGGG